MEWHWKPGRFTLRDGRRKVAEVWRAKNGRTWIYRGRGVAGIAACWEAATLAAVSPSEARIIAREVPLVPVRERSGGVSTARTRDLLTRARVAGIVQRSVKR